MLRIQNIRVLAPAENVFEKPVKMAFFVLGVFLETIKVHRGPGPPRIHTGTLLWVKWWLSCGEYHGYVSVGGYFSVPSTPQDCVALCGGGLLVLRSASFYVYTCETDTCRDRCRLTISSGPVVSVSSPNAHQHTA